MLKIQLLTNLSNELSNNVSIRNLVNNGNTMAYRQMTKCKGLSILSTKCCQHLMDQTIKNHYSFGSSKKIYTYIKNAVLIN